MKKLSTRTTWGRLLSILLMLTAASSVWAAEAPQAQKQPHRQRPVAAPQAQPSSQPSAETGSPQRFELSGKEPVSFGFAVTQPGVVVIEVLAQGAPVRVDVSGPQPQTQAGAGRLVFNLQITPTDIQRGVLWSVRVGLQNPPATPTQPLAGGTVAVRAPPVDHTVVQQQLSALTSQNNVAAQQAEGAIQADIGAKLQSSRAQLGSQQDAIRKGAELSSKPILERFQGQGQISTRGLSGLRTPQFSAIAPQDTTTATRIGAVPPATNPPPRITQMDVPKALPRQLVIIQGTGFGSQPGEVQFVVNPGVVYAGLLSLWTDTTIALYVPDASGILGYAGQVTIVRPGDGQRSNAWPLEFVPELQIRQIYQTSDAAIANPGQMGGNKRYVFHGWDNLGDAFVGARNNDLLFPSTRLQNGWVVESGQVYPFSNDINGRAIDAYPIETRPGSDMPFMRVHWWRDAFAELRYSFLVQIKGPRGVPDGVVCTQAPCT